MHNSPGYHNWTEYTGRKIAITLNSVLLLAICIFGAIPRHQVFGQSKPRGTRTSPLCSRDKAFEMIKQQVELTKTFDDPIRRITVLIRAADLLWPYEQRKSRAVFTDAFELATENEKENDAKGPRSVVLRMQTPDQRYAVIRAVAKRDAAWAKELTQQMLKLDTQADEDSSRRDSFEDVLTATKLLDSAHKLIASDINAAFDLARVSLDYNTEGSPDAPLAERRADHRDWSHRT